MKSVQIRSFSWSVFSQRFTEEISVFKWNMGKYGPERTPCLDAFHAVVSSKALNCRKSFGKTKKCEEKLTDCVRMQELPVKN